MLNTFFFAFCIKIWTFELKFILWVGKIFSLGAISLQDLNSTGRWLIVINKIYCKILDSHKLFFILFLSNFADPEQLLMFLQTFGLQKYAPKTFFNLIVSQILTWASLLNFCKIFVFIENDRILYITQTFVVICFWLATALSLYLKP